MSTDPTEAVQWLADVLTQENAALKRLDYPAAVALVPAKAEALAQLTGQASLPATPPALAKHVAELAAENQLLLERAITVQTQIVRIVARASSPSTADTRYRGYGGGVSAARATAMAVSTRA